MQDNELKQKVLDEMMNFMDELEGEGLKKHPKLMAAKLEVKPNDESLEDPKEEALESPLEEKSEDEVDPDLLKKLEELLNK